MYGEGKSLRYIIGIIAIIVLLFVVILMIVRHGNNNDQSKVPETKQTLSSYANNTNVTITERIIGPVVSDQNHSELEINVTNAQTTINAIKGYDGNIINSRSYPMTTASFTEFLNSLEKAGFTKGNTDESLKDDSGYCSTGRRYVYEIHDGANSIQRFWASSCNSTKTYRGNVGLTNTLFRAQVPDYEQFTSGANLGNDFSIF